MSPSKAAKRTPDYRLHTIRTLPQLQLLDDFKVRQSERRQVRTKPTTPREAGMAGCTGGVPGLTVLRRQALALDVSEAVSVDDDLLSLRLSPL